MSLKQLNVANVRNLQEVQLQNLQPVNVFYGRNGSGKTSLLESIHLLGMARSFRGNSIKPLISHGQSQCTVFGTVAQRDSDSSGVAIGVQRELSGAALIKVAGTPVRRTAELVERFPLQVITADSFGLLTGPPVGRRQYLDWGVFHVEHRFFGEWQRFQRCIKQRNNLLRRGKITDQELAVWTKELGESGAAISEYRKAYYEILLPRFQVIMGHLAPALNELEIGYRQGWDKQLSYSDALQNSRTVDLEQGYTHSGPQRADLRVTQGGHLASETLSRGQQKLVVCGLKLAQGQLMSEMGQGRCTYLIDDLPSELDEQHSRLVCSLLESMQAQVFMTCVRRQDIAEVWPQDKALAMFHVEHGKVTASSS